MKKLFSFFSKTDKVSFWICLTISMTLIITSFVTPPMWIIDNSVLMASGELWGFAALGVAIHAISRGSDVTVQKGDTQITMTNPDNPDEDVTEGNCP